MKSKIITSVFCLIALFTPIFNLEAEVDMDKIYYLYVTCNSEEIMLKNDNGRFSGSDLLLNVNWCNNDGTSSCNGWCDYISHKNYDCPSDPSWHIQFFNNLDKYKGPSSENNPYGTFTCYGALDSDFDDMECACGTTMEVTPVYSTLEIRTIPESGGSVIIEADRATEVSNDISGAYSTNQDFTLASGDSVTMTAVAHEGYAFDDWLPISSLESQTFTATGANTSTYTAYFNPQVAEVSEGEGNPNNSPVLLDNEGENMVLVNHLKIAANNTNEDTIIINDMLYEVTVKDSLSSETYPHGMELSLYRDPYCTAGENLDLVKTGQIYHSKYLEFYPIDERFKPGEVRCYSLYANISQERYCNEITTSISPDGQINAEYESLDKDDNTQLEFQGSTINGSVFIVGDNCDVTLHVDINPPEGGTVQISPEKEVYDLGETVTLTASPNEGYVFNGWTGDYTGDSTTITIRMKSLLDITANFSALETYKLSLTVKPEEASDFVSVAPNKTEYYAGENVTLFATSTLGYKFSKWSGIDNGDAMSAIASFPMNSDKLVTAFFKAPPPSGEEEHGKTEDPVNTATGEFYFVQPLFDLGGPMNLSLDIYYGSGTSNKQAITTAFGDDLGKNLVHNFHIKIDSATDSRVDILYDNGKILTFESNDDEWDLITMEQNPFQLKKGDSGKFYLLDPLKAYVYVFSTDLTLEKITDRSGNALLLSYDANANLSTVSDGLGRTILFTYSDDRLTTISDGYGRSYNLTFDNGSLLAITDPMGYVTSYTYNSEDSGLIEKITLPKGNHHYVQEYNADGKVSAQIDAFGNVMTIDYMEDKTVITYPDANQTVHEHYNEQFLRSITDPNGVVVSLDYDEAGRRTELVDQTGAVTQVSYDSNSGKKTSASNPLGDTMTNEFNTTDQTFEEVTFTFHDMAKKMFPGGESESYESDSAGRVIKKIDPAGNVHTQTYNEKGQPLVMTLPGGDTLTFTYNDDGALATAQNSDSGLSTYVYDTYKRPIQKISPDGSVLRLNYDLNDRLTEVTDPLGRTTLFSYDENGNMISATDAGNRKTTYTYDAMDRKITATDDLGKVSAYGYDNMGRMESITFPTGETTRFQFGNTGYLTSMTDSGGNRWEYDVDASGVPLSLTKPEGERKTKTVDSLGRGTGISDDEGNQWINSFDKNGALTSMSDSLGRSAYYTYDPRGNLSAISWDEGLSASYIWDSNGKLTGITDPNGNHWFYNISGWGRALENTDPLGNQWSYSYDSKGRLTNTVFPDGASETYTYDLADNITEIAYSTGKTIHYTYNDADWMTSTEGLSLEYNAVGNITGTIDREILFGAEYDSGGRLHKASYNNNEFLVTYSYDERDLLTKVSDDLTGTIMEFIYNANAELTKIIRSNSIHTTYIRDSKGRITAVYDEGVASQEYILNSEGEVIRSSSSLPFGDSLALSSKSEESAFDSANQISGSQWSYDRLGNTLTSPEHSFAWDMTGKPVTINEATMTYNGVRELRTRTQEDGAIHYYYNYAFNGQPPMAEQNETTGSFSKYYVWSPNGYLLYMIDAEKDNDLSFYHFDRLGSTAFLTDKNGTVTDQYEYLPYGELVSHLGGSTQPFTFLGRHGIRQEGDSGMYHIRDRYYDSKRGRFLSRDSKAANIYDLESLNPYIYTTNPVKYIDITGNSKEEVFVVLINTAKKGPKVLKATGKGASKTGSTVGTAMDKSSGKDSNRFIAEVLSAPTPGSSEAINAVENFGDNMDESFKNIVNMPGSIVRDTIITPLSLARMGIDLGVPEPEKTIQKLMNDPNDIYGKLKADTLQQIIGIRNAIEASEQGWGESGYKVYSLLGAAGANPLEIGPFYDRKKKFYSSVISSQVGKDKSSDANPVVRWSSELGYSFAEWWYSDTDAKLCGGGPGC